MKIIDRIVFCILNNKNILITGAPGIGKTKITLHACKLAGIKPENIIFIHSSIKSPTDFTGLPFKDKDSDCANFIPYGDLYRMINTKEKLVIFFDDLGQGSALVQAAIMQIVEERKIGDKTISPLVSFVLATNRAGDGAGVKNILEPLKGRCAIYGLEVDHAAWIKWAIGANLHPVIIAYIKNNPSALHDFESSVDIVNTPSPRNWERLNAFIDQSFFDCDDVIANVGIKHGALFFEYYQNYNRLSHIPKQVFSNPLLAEVPERKYMIALLSVLLRFCVNNFDETAFAKCITYAKRFNENEMCNWMVESIIAQEKKYIDTKTYLQYTANK